MNLTHWKCKLINFLDRGQLFQVTKCYQWKIPYVFKLRNMRSIKFVSWTLLVIEESLSLFGRSMIQHFCLFDFCLFVPFHSMA